MNRSWCVRLGSTLVLLAAGGGCLHAQQFRAIDRGRAQVMLRQVHAALDKWYYDSTFHGLDLSPRFDSASARIDRAQSLGEAMAAIAQVTLGLGDSHTFFVPPATTVSVEYGWDLGMVGEACMVTRVAQGSDADRQGVHPGDLVLAVNGYRPTRENLWQLLYLYRVLRPQRGLRVLLQRGTDAPKQLDLAADVRHRRLVVDLTGADGGEDISRLIWNAERRDRELRPAVVVLDDRVAVVRLPTFSINRKDARKLIEEAGNAQAMILDLRGNAGGPIRTLEAVASALSRDGMVLAMARTRQGTDTLRAEPGDAHAFGGRLIVLVDAGSASASELLAAAVEATGRGTVVGDRTAGAVMEARYHAFHMTVETAVFYGLNLTEGALVIPDGRTLEGRGLTPDRVLLPSSADLAAGRDPVLADALASVGLAVTPEAAGRLFEE